MRRFYYSIIMNEFIQLSVLRRNEEAMSRHCCRCPERWVIYSTSELNKYVCSFVLLRDDLNIVSGRRRRQLFLCYANLAQRSLLNHRSLSIPCNGNSHMYCNYIMHIMRLIRVNGLVTFVILYTTDLAWMRIIYWPYLLVLETFPTLQSIEIISY